MRRLPGYIALITVIITMVVLFILGALVSFQSYRTRSDELATRFKLQSKMAAEGCLEHALLQLSLNNTYSGNESVTLSQSPQVVCQIVSVSSAGPNKIIRVTATIHDYVTNLALTVDGTSLNQVSLQEVRSFE